MNKIETVKEFKRCYIHGGQYNQDECNHSCHLRWD